MVEFRSPKPVMWVRFLPPLPRAGREKMTTLLCIGTGQIGKAVLRELLQTKKYKIVVVHNLTEKESLSCIDQFQNEFSEIKFISSYGNIFMPIFLKDLSNNDLYLKFKEIMEYFYSDLTEEIIQQSSIYALISKYKPDIIIDAINTATVLGNSYNPEQKKIEYQKDPELCCQHMMVDDFTTKLVNFISSLKYSLEKFSVRKYIKVSTTGLGGMGMNMPYTHGDNPKMNLSLALMGKISASGILHQLLWNLSHTKGVDVSIVIPGTFVGCDSAKDEIVDNSFGFVEKNSNYLLYPLKTMESLEYSSGNQEGYIRFPVIRAGENHVYSLNELKTLTAIGQMEAITKEEVADAVVQTLNSNSKHDILAAMDGAMLHPTYLGKEMVENVSQKLSRLKYPNGIATGNLGITCAKHLYELFCMKNIARTIELLKKDDLVEKINSFAKENKELLTEIVSLGLVVLFDDNSIAIGKYTLCPKICEDKTVTDQNIKQWSNVGWVDLRRKNIEHWTEVILQIKQSLDKNRKKCYNCYSEGEYNSIADDYDIANVLAYHYNLQNKGRKR